jgi:multimeric flavodoxin WrbA
MKSNNPQKQVLGIMASPRKQANTDILLDAALKAARKHGAKTQKIVINDLNFVPCQDCENVRNDGKCKIEDDFQLVFEALLRADTVFVASPIYFGSISAQLKMLIDRFQCYWRTKYVTQTVDGIITKKGGFICVQASSRDDFFENARSIVKNFFVTAGIEYCREVFCSRIDKKGSVKNNSNCMEKAVVMGEKLS